MENSVLYNPTKLHFGKDVVKGLGKAVSKIGKKVLLVYGGGSIKKNGVYQDVMDQLNAINAEVVEFSGIKPNPIFQDADAAAKVGRENNVDVIVAVGGGSVIDSAKGIAISIPAEHSVWDFYKGKAMPKAATPIVAVLTLAATGTEMNPYSVLQNNETNEKIGWGMPLMYPKHSFLDPAYTLSVNEAYTSYGVADLMAHCLEAFFGKGDASLSDKFVFAILSEAVEYGPKLMMELQNYSFREKIMYAATMALNGTTAIGRNPGGDWGVHSIGHVLSVLYDVPHGATLSIAFPAWMKLNLNKIEDRLVLLGEEVFGVEGSDRTIDELENFFVSIGCPIRLSDIPEYTIDREEILAAMNHNRVGGMHYTLSPEDYPRLLDLML